MGIDAITVGLLARARRQGAAFQRSIALGRQRLYIQPARLRATRRGLQSLTGSDWPKVEAALAEPLFEPLFHALGAEVTDSLDVSAYEGASVLHDLNVPLPEERKERYSFVFDGGCLEHVFHYPTALKSAMELVEIGGHFATMTPANNYCGHGFYQVCPELLYRALGETNGFRVVEMAFVEILPERTRCFRVPDPMALKRRIDLRTGSPVLLWTLAQRTERKNIFAVPPQQSDYAATWDAPGAHVDHVGAAKIQAGGSWKDSLLRLPGGVLHFARRMKDAFVEPLSRTPGLVEFRVEEGV